MEGGSVAPEIPPSEVIDEEENDVGLLGLGLFWNGNQWEEREECKKAMHG